MLAPPVSSPGVDILKHEPHTLEITKMKRYFLALAALAITTPVWAQAQSQGQPLYGPYLANSGTIQQVSGGRFLSGHGCDADCGTCSTGRTVCVPEPTTIKHTKNLYSSQCGHACYRKCSLLGFLTPHNNCDSGCADGGCSHAFTTKFLVKKVCTTECPGTKCVPAPGCDGGHGLFRHQAGVSGAPVEVIHTAPMPMPKK